MFEKYFGELKLWQFQNLSERQEVNHYVSGREGGVSSGAFGTLNLSYKVGDQEVNVMNNRKRLAAGFGLAAKDLVFPVQTHSTNIGIVTERSKGADFEDTDALVTNCKDVCISVMSADCVPVLLYDPVSSSIAAIHAGWKGTVGRIVTATIETMVREYGAKPEWILAGIGPSISPEVYEVGEEVIESVTQTFDRTETLLKPSCTPDKAYFDLWEANKRQLLDLGVREECIEIAGKCTYLNSDLFFSARKSGYNAGRFAAGIALKSSILP